MSFQRNAASLFIVSASVFLTACGSSKSSSDSDNGTQIRGTLNAAIASAVDSDINDIRANFSANNSPDNPQVLNNSLLTLQGYVSKNATGGNSNEERFANTPDEFDYYRINLQKDQRVAIRVAGINNTATISAALIELDDNNQIVDSGAVEANARVRDILFIANKASKYLVRIKAASGSSRYIMQLQSAQKNASSQKSNNEFVAGQMLVKMKPGKSPAQMMSQQPGQFSIQSVSSLQAQTSELPLLLNINQLSAFSGQQNLISAQADPLQKIAPNAYEKIDTLEKIAELKRRDDVEYAQPNYIYQSLATPNDNSYSKQWGLNQINAPLAWDISTGERSGGGNVIVAVLDTGVLINHPDIQGQLVPGYDFINDVADAADGNGLDNNPNDPGNPSQPGTASFHGTHVAGIVAAASNNQLGVAGTSWQAKVMPVRVLGKTGAGSSYSLINGMRYAAGLANDSGQLPTQAADIINMSLGSTFDAANAPAEISVINQIYAKNIMLVAAAGNSNTAIPFYPASFDHVISVSSTNFSQQLSHFSNFGSTIDVAAPGGSSLRDDNNDGQADFIINLGATDATGSIQYGLTGKVGTSMSAPHVAGVLALMKAVYPALTAAQVNNLLSNGVLTTDIGPAGKDNSFGYGRIDALKAVKEAQKLANGGQLPPQPTQLIADPQSLLAGQADEVNITIKNVGGKSPTLSVSSSEDWLTLEAIGNADTALSNNATLTYKAKINREGLGLGFYNATIRATADGDDNPAAVNIEVFMQVGNFSIDGELTQQYVLLIGGEESKVLKTVAAGRDGSFVIPDVAPGKYQLVAGSDIDVDNKLCLTAETCGFYPPVGGESINVQNTDVTDINFTVSTKLLDSSSQASQSDSDNRRLQGGIEKTTLLSTDEIPDKIFK